MAITDSLISYYKLDESSGNAADSVGSNTLTNTGTATYSTAKINNGVSLNGSTQYLVKTSPTGMPTAGGARSVSAWIKPSAWTGDIVQWGDNTGSGKLFELYTYSNNNITADVSGGTASFTVSTMSAGTWYHIVLTYPGSGTTWTLYFNGSSQTATGGTPNTDTAASLCIGRNYEVGVGNFSGMIDEVGIWSRALTSTEVSQLYNSGTGRQYPFPGLDGAGFLGMM